MEFIQKILKVKSVLFSIMLLLLPVTSEAQHRGDDLSFQGLADKNELGVRATALGNAFTAVPGDLSAIFYNPAGLARLNSITVSVSGNSYSKDWRENQDYRPNRYFVTLPFYLEGLYIPKPEDNGKFDHELAKDTSFIYEVNSPKLGLDPFSEEAADWVKNQNNFALNNIAAAYPFQIGKNKFVAAVSYNERYNIVDYDRNDTYLNPHPGDRRYGDLSRVNGIDTMVVNWSRFTRERTGKINSIDAALAYTINETFQLGAAINYQWGSTDDYQNLVRVGSFDLVDENRFRFYYQDVYEEVNGTSDLSALSYSVGAIASLNKFTLGVNVQLPYTLKREWSYTRTYRDSISNSTTNSAGTDELNYPLVLNFGINFKPIDNFMLAFDYETAKFSKAEFNLTSTNASALKWVDRNSIRLGIEYSPYDFIAFQAGYKNVPQVFVPDGAAERDRGPEAVSYTFGLSLNLFFGRIDAAYEIRKLTYYDSYFSNTNYVTENYSNILFGFTYSL